MLTYALSFSVDRTVFRVTMSQIVCRFMGETEKTLEALFDLAKELSPSLIVFEEVDSIGRRRKQEEPDAERRMKLEVLRHLDSLDDMPEDVICIGTTNLPWELDSAFLRRFERRVFMGPLNKSDRAAFIQGRGWGPFDAREINELADLSRGLTGFELENALNELALSLASRGENENPDFAMLRKRLKLVKPSVTAKKMSFYINFLQNNGMGHQLEEIDADLIETKFPQYFV